MAKATLRAPLAWGSAVCMALSLSCVPPGMPTEELSDEERSAVQQASRVMFMLAEAAGVGNAAVSAAAAPAAPAKSVDGNVAVEGCPVLTLAPASATGVFNYTLDFGTGCPLPGQESPVCVGGASGQVDIVTNILNLTLQALSCGEAPILDGTAVVNFSRSAESTTFVGNWDLTFTSEGESTRITGPGTITFNASTQIVIIENFQGQLTRGEDTWNITMNSVQIPLADNPDRLPSAGTVQLDGGFLRQLTIRFNENTPSTGVVEVGLFGLFFFPVDLDTLPLGAARAVAVGS